MRNGLAIVGLGLALAWGIATTRAVHADSVADAAQASGAWEQVSDSGGIKVYRREVPGSDIIAFKGEGVIDAPVVRVGSVILDQARVPEWAQNVRKIKTVQRVADNELVEYTHVGTPFVLKDRDFVTRMHYEVDRASGEVHFDYKGVEHPDAPVTGYVRGQVLSSAFTLRPIEGGSKTLFVGEIQADPKGSVPKWLVNFFQKSWPRKTLEALRRQCRKTEVVDNAGLVARLSGRATASR